MTFARILDGPWPIPSSRAGPPYRMPPNEIRSDTPSVVRMLIGRSQTLPSLLLPHSKSGSNSLRRRKPGFALRMHGCGRRLPRCRRNPRLSAGTILARVAAAKSSRSAASIEGLPGSPYRACCEEGARQTGAITSFSNPFSLATLTIVEVEPVERDARRQARRTGIDPEALPALGPAVAEIAILMDVRLVAKDHQMLVALSAGQHIPEPLDKGLPPLRVGPAQQLLGFLPRQLEAVQGRSDRLATAPQPKALAHPRDEAAQGPAWRWISPGSGRRRGRALGGADRLAAFGCAVRAKKGRRPPVRRNASASGPWAL